jgi:hypothetical protein
MVKFGFGKGQKFDLIQAPLGRNGSYFFVYEDYNLPILRLGNFKNDNLMQGGDFNFDIKLYQPAPAGGYREVRYWYFGDAGSIRFQQYGEAAKYGEIALTDRDHLRIRGNSKITISLRGKTPGREAAACEGVFSFLDGSGTEADFGKYGKFFFKTLKGGVDISEEYKDGICVDFTVSLLPDKSGELDIALYEYDRGKEFDYRDKFEPFDELIAANKADFEEFKKNYTKVAKGYEETAEYAMWLIWSHRVKAGGYYKSPMILMHLQWLTAAASWQQAYNAMPMQGNPKEAWRQICSLFEHQDEKTGQLPGMLFYTGAGAVQPPFQGFALDFVIRKCGDGFITVESAKRMYPKFAKWINYWTTYKSAGRGDDVISASSPHDSGWDDASIFADGFPASNPDIMAFLVVIMECTAKLAKIAGDEAAAKEFEGRAKKLLQTIINEFWDDDKGLFVTKKHAKDPVDSLSLAGLQPILLGDRLPKNIIDKVAANLTKDGEWLSPIGLMTESLKSPKLGLAHQFVLGRVVAPANMILCVGLSLAGKTKEASMIARRYCDNIVDKGMVLGFSPVDTYPDNHESQAGQPIDFDLPPIASDPWPWSTWTANCFLTLAESVVE